MQENQFVFRPSSDQDGGVPKVWQIGDVILNQYEVRAKLGQGGMGIVHKVYHREWDMDLAVKSPRPEIFSKGRGQENFVREALTWVALSPSPHIVRCYFVLTLGSIPRIFSEYVAGGSLLDWIKLRTLYEGGHKQALERLLDVAIQFAWGLHAAHEQGLIHQAAKFTPTDSSAHFHKGVLLEELGRGEEAFRRL